MGEQEHPVLEYTDKVLGDEVISNTLGLDKMVLYRWDKFMEEGNFRYNTNNIKEKVIEGKLGYLVQSQLERARLRRPPQSMMSIRQAFDEQGQEGRPERYFDHQRESCRQGPLSSSATSRI